MYWRSVSMRNVKVMANLLFLIYGERSTVYFCPNDWQKPRLHYAVKLTQRELTPGASLDSVLVSLFASWPLEAAFAANISMIPLGCCEVCLAAEGAWPLTTGALPAPASLGARDPACADALCAWGTSAGALGTAAAHWMALNLREEAEKSHQPFHVVLTLVSTPVAPWFSLVLCSPVMNLSARTKSIQMRSMLCRLWGGGRWNRWHFIPKQVTLSEACSINSMLSDVLKHLQLSDALTESAAAAIAPGRWVNHNGNRTT